MVRPFCEPSEQSWTTSLFAVFRDGKPSLASSRVGLAFFEAEQLSWLSSDNFRRVDILDRIRVAKSTFTDLSVWHVFQSAHFR